MKATCENCKFWRRWTVQPQYRHAQPDFGDCRKKSPTTVPESGKTKWPSTPASDFCGEHVINLEAAS